MEPKDWVALVSVLTTLVIFLVTLVVNRRKENLQRSRDDALRKEQQSREDNLRRELQAREDALREEQQKRENSRREKERIHKPRIEFGINCIFYGPHHDSFLAEFQLTTNNKGLVKHEVGQMTLRVRGIKSDKPLTYLPGHGQRLNFPERLLPKVSVIPPKAGYLFVEPGARQVVTYITKIPSSTQYILAHAEFWYDENLNHTTEQIFPVVIK